MDWFLSRWKRWSATPAGSRICCVLLSLVFLAPCYWQPRMHGADLSSPMDYAWFAQWMESGRWQGLQAVSTTNVLFDALLAGFVRLFGPEIGQRLCVSAIVLIFVWGAFAFVCAAKQIDYRRQGDSGAESRPWHLLPSIAVLAYGWVFHMGFFNFYLSLGLCFWVLALVCESRPKRAAIALPLLVLAYTAHPLPAAWAVCIVLYLWAAKRVSARQRSYISAGILGIILICFLIAARSVHGASSMKAIWTGVQMPIAAMNGKYNLVGIGILLAWGVLFLDLLHQTGPRKVVSGAAFQVCVLSTAAVALLPATVLLPGFDHTVIFVAERMSLGVGVCLCAMLAAARPRPVVRWTLVAAAVVFFVFIYRDERRVNSLEDSMQDTVAQSLN